MAVCGAIMANEFDSDELVIHRVFNLLYWTAQCNGKQLALLKRKILHRKMPISNSGAK